MNDDNPDITQQDIKDHLDFIVSDMNPPLDEPLMSRDGRTYTTKEVIELTLNPSSGLTEADQQFGTQQRQRTINSLNRMRLQHRRYVRRLQQLLSDRTKNDKHFL